jgi:ketosteroid isomerase-like protein
MLPPSHRSAHLVSSAIPTIELFRAIDARDPMKFVSFLAPDASFRYGSAAPVTGREAIAQAVAGFFGTIQALEHRLLHQWQDVDSQVCEGEVTYTRHDGSRITLPFVVVLRPRAGLIQDYRIYVDIAPLYAASG